MALLFAELGEYRLREGLARLHRSPAGRVATRSTRFLRAMRRDATIDEAVARLLVAAARGVCRACPAV